MKKLFILFYSIILTILICSCSNSNTDHATVDDLYEDIIDITNVEKVNKSGYSPISTDSIKELLLSTNHFSVSEFEHEYETDVYCSLDKTDNNAIAKVFFLESEEKTTRLISYNFQKSELENSSYIIKWGLKNLLYIFDVDLSDKMWEDLLKISSNNDTADPLGKDYIEFSDEEKRIEIIYADLGENLQVDIKFIK